jgi:hypothetical protein
MAKINGAHAIIYTTDAEADRGFFRDVIGAPGVDVGGGWIIFGLPPAEVAFHPGSKNDSHELYLMCDDIEGFVADMETRGVACTPISDQGWGRLSQVTLPGGGTLGVYEPRHARPEPMGDGKKAKKAKPAKKTKSTKKAKSAAKKPKAKKMMGAPKIGEASAKKAKKGEKKKKR